MTLRRRPADSYNGSTMGTFAVKFVVSHPLLPERRVELEGRRPREFSAGDHLIDQGERPLPR